VDPPNGRERRAPSAKGVGMAPNGLEALGESRQRVEPQITNRARSVPTVFVLHTVGHPLFWAPSQGESCRPTIQKCRGETSPAPVMS